MAASQSTTITKQELDEKYNIKRPQYDEEDLIKLQRLVITEQKTQIDWQDLWLEESVLIRFLKAFLTVEDAFTAIQKYCDWRIKYGVENISPHEDCILRETAVGRDLYFKGVEDKCGRPIVVMYPYLHDAYHGDYDSIYRYIVFKLEQMCAVCDINGSRSFCIICDLKGFSMRNMDYQCIKKIVWFMKNCYPERLGVCLVINYPWLFYGCYEIIKHWLNEVTRSKILFCGAKELQDFIDVKNFPVPLIV
ncbi:uncharacterized protein LOC130625015 [Hydractinia symbiolongicarpus]|uniref:uncharacterized protein LOC130625015 n=1 Tax=Hydractinia symbiolongicarpus TaxID=13093 RepID=UPI00254DA01A|nr:uncharacterized protein LOC130625015 [Hydractinia symbiolongicarpus]